MPESRFSYPGTELDALAEAQNYYDVLLGYFANHIGQRSVEVGAGIGTFSEFLLRAPTLSRLTLIEPADNNFPLLQQRFAGNGRVCVLHGYLEDLAGELAAEPVDSLGAVNVLEHVVDDAAFLRAAYDILVPGGTVLLFVPALPPLYGSLDAAFGHVRRYTKSSLGAVLQAAGFQPVSLRYVNAPGVLAWFLTGRVLRRTTLRPEAVRFYDRWVVPWVARIEHRWEPPVGQSILAIATKP